MTKMPQITLPGGDTVPAYGQGTWHMGESRIRFADEAAALKLEVRAAASKARNQVKVGKPTNGRGLFTEIRLSKKCAH